MRFCYMEGIGESDLILPQCMQNDFNETNKTMTFAFGGFKKEVNVKFSTTIGSEIIGIHRQFAETFSMLFEVDFKWRVERDTFYVGPVIAFIFNKQAKKITSKRLRKLKKYTACYKDVGGLFIIASADSIDFENKTINGYYFYTGGPDIKGTWMPGRFPFPEVLFRRGKAAALDQLSELMDGKAFNYPLLNKWELYDKLSDSPEVSHYFPETVQLQEKDRVVGMLGRFKCIYLKPAGGMKAAGIYTVTLEGDQYAVKNVGNQTKHLDYGNFTAFLESLNNTPYIAQQPIMNSDLDRNIVFRVILQKNKEKTWKCSGTYARIGVKGSIATNRVLTDYFLPTSQALREVYKLSKKAARGKKQEIIGMCKKVCRELDDKNVHYGDVAFDVMVDSNLRVWIIELNNRSHNHNSPLKTIKDRKMYRRVVAAPLVYAGALAGF
ncbi:YheC/YheD family endospore coat-associated protein [Bacillus sp. EB01]|uniref:YheC/YheD family endospore coat-associated protein n=1 Tax=Bacillus sp. EB01 TaxID=1347086 RepID=UPI0005C4EA4D|nr:YheC/YheD family protein [Bacillus sp. EB01]